MHEAHDSCVADSAITLHVVRALLGLSESRNLCYGYFYFYLFIYLFFFAPQKDTA